MNRCEEVLAHHGIKGMKWGVRRYQNKDGTLTEEGRRRREYGNRVKANYKSTNDVNEIVASLSNKEKKMLGASLHEKWIEDEIALDKSTQIIKRFLEKDGDKPMSFLEIYEEHDNQGRLAGSVALATHKDYRGHGLAAKNTKKMIEWFDRYGNKKLSELGWIVNKNNPKSIAIAKEFGFMESEKPDTKEWDDYYLFTYKGKNRQGGNLNEKRH